MAEILHFDRFSRFKKSLSKKFDEINRRYTTDQEVRDGMEEWIAEIRQELDRWCPKKEINNGSVRPQND